MHLANVIEERMEVEETRKKMVEWDRPEEWSKCPQITRNPGKTLRTLNVYYNVVNVYTARTKSNI